MNRIILFLTILTLLDVKPADDNAMTVTAMAIASGSAKVRGPVKIHFFTDDPLRCSGKSSSLR